jgi:hypothetical protein
MSFGLTCLLAPSSRRSLASMTLSKVTSETSLPNNIGLWAATAASNQSARSEKDYE